MTPVPRSTAGRRSRRLSTITALLAGTLLLVASCSDSTPHPTMATSGGPSSGAPTSPAAAPPRSTALPATSPARSTPSTSSGRSAPAGTAALTVVTAALGAAGIDVVPDESPSHGRGTITITASQAAVWAEQLRTSTGLTGRELRERFPTGESAVPIDAMVAAWLTLSSGRPAQAARHLVDPSGIADPQDFRYPWAVLAMFVQDLTSTTPAPLSSAPSRLRAPGSAAFDPCGQLSGLYDAVIGQITAWFSTAGADSTIVSIATEAIGLFGSYLGKAISAALAPLLAPIKAAIGALGVATAVAGALAPWTAEIVAEPTQAAFGITPAPGQTGRFELRVSTPLPDWPTGVRSCASLAGVELPPIHPAGSTVTWTFSGGQVATEQQHDSALADGPVATAALDFVTGTETPEQAAGSLLIDPVMVAAEVLRDTSALSAVLNKLIGSALNALPDLIVVLLTGPVTDAMSGVLAASGPATVSDPVPVSHHLAPPISTPGPKPTAEEEGCIDVDLVSLAGPTTEGGMTVFMPAGALLRLNADHTGFIDFSRSSAYVGQDVSGTVRGIMTFHWTGGPKDFTSSAASGDLTATVKAGGTTNTIDLPVDTMAQEGEHLRCTDGDLTFLRTGWVFY